MSTMDTRSRGHFLKLFKNRVFRLTMLEWSKLPPPPLLPLSPRSGRHWFSIFQHRATDIGRTQSSRLIKQHANSANSYILKRTHGKLTSCKQDTRWILRKYWLAVRSSADMPTIPLYVWQIHRPCTAYLGSFRRLIESSRRNGYTRADRGIQPVEWKFSDRSSLLQRFEENGRDRKKLASGWRFDEL